MNAREEADSSGPVVVMGGTASERSSGHCARLWTSVGHWRDGKNLERHTSDVGAHMAPLGVETAGRACYSINNTTFAMYSERDSLRRPWAHVGRSARSARIGSVVMGGVCATGGTSVVEEGLTPFPSRGSWVRAWSSRPSPVRACRVFW